MTGPSWSARVPLAVGAAAIALLCGGFGAWSVGTEIAGAIVTVGTVQVQSERQVVQHPDGGVVGEILARDGDRVEAGDVLIRLDGTFLRSELLVVERQLAEIFARRARLEAERDGAGAPDFGDPPRFSLVPPAAIAEQIAGQRTLFAARRSSLAGERGKLAEQQGQIDRQIDGMEAQLTGLRRQRALIGDELRGLDGLLADGLVQIGRVLALRREEARLEGEIGRLAAEVAEAETRISMIGMERLRLADARREQAVTELRDLAYAEIELSERRISLEERLQRLDLRAPVAGVVIGARVSAVHSVVQAAEPVLYLVPGDQPLQVSARVDPIDVDQVHPGQEATLVFSTFDRRTTPEVAGTIVRVSADAEIDERSGLSYYEAVVLPDAGALARLGQATLLPGMPAEVFLRTENRTPLAYLAQPLATYFNRAFRED